MTWPRYLDILDYWRAVPPIADCVAAYITGGKRPEPDDATPLDPFEALQRDFAAIG